MLAAVVPALNEAETIGDLVRQLKRRADLVIVVNGGPTDKTKELTSDAGAQVIENETGVFGLGVCILEGMKAAMSDGRVKHILTIDAGGSHDPLNIDRLILRKADIVIGSRFCEGGEYIGNKRREIASRVAAIACRFAKRKPKISDWTSGYRLYSREAAGKLIYANYAAKGHAFQIEVLTQAIRRGMVIREAPIRYQAGRSSLRMKSIDEAFSAWLELLFS